VGRDKLRHRLSAPLVADRWVVDGNYIDEVADLAWPIADMIVWLDPPRSVAIRRSVLRSAMRAVRATELWNGNRESLAVVSPISITRLVRRWPSYPARIARALVELDIPAATVARLRSDPEVQRWIDST
jgi:hypothetical protein